MHLFCQRCGHVEETSTLKSRCDCGGLWNLDFCPPAFDLSEIDTSQWSMFRYRDFMALEDESWRDVSLGEGMTPVIRLNRRVLLKMDYLMPTLSYKDRGAAALIAHCKAIGVKSVVQDSSGNAGNAVAAYCARAGIKCRIFVPEGTSPKKIAMIRAHGAACIVVPGGRDRCAEVCRATARDEGVYYASHVYSPFFYEGTKTFIYEIFEHLRRIPPVLVIPVGNGTLFLGAVAALQDLLRARAISEMPQILAVQSERCDPLLRAARAGLHEPAEVVPQPTAAEGIAIGRPARGAEILAAARKYGVRFIHAPEKDILPARQELARAGLYVEHTTAANYAAYCAYCKTFGPVPETLITLCGAGLKSDR